MKKGGGKVKGAQFEREVCLDLSLWVSNRKLQDCFWRSALSGGRATLARLKNRSESLLRAQRGDITPIRREGMLFNYLFRAECKSYRNLRIDRMLESPLDNTSSELNQFWTKLRKECERDRDLPILFAKQNNVEPFVLLNSRGVALLRLGSGMIGFWVAAFKEHDAYLIRLSTFLEKAVLKIPPLRIQS